VKEKEGIAVTDNVPTPFIAKQSSLSSDHPIVRVEQTGLGMGGNGLLDLGQFVGVPRIVRIQKGHIPAMAFRNAPIPGRRRTAVGLPDVVNTALIGPEHFGGIV
jgi:hypothetical protein